MSGDLPRAKLGAPDGLRLRGDHVVAALGSLLLCRAFGGSGRDGTMVASITWLVAAGARWGRGPRMRPATWWVGLGVAAAFCAAVTVRFGQAAQVDTVALDAVSSLVGFANLRFGRIDVDGVAPWPMASLFEPFVVVAALVQSIVAVEVGARLVRWARGARRSGPAAGEAAIAAGAVAIVAATAAVALDRFADVSPGEPLSLWPVVAFSVAAALSAGWSDRSQRVARSVGRSARDRRPRSRRAPVVATLVSVASMAGLVVAALGERRLVLGSAVAEWMSPPAVAAIGPIAAAVAAVTLWDVAGGVVVATRSRWAQVVRSIAASGPIPWLIVAPTASAQRVGFRTWSWTAIAAASTVCALAVGVAVVAAGRGVARRGIGFVAAAELAAIGAGALLIGGAASGPYSADPSRPLSLGPTSPRVVVIADHTVLSTIRTVGVTPSVAAPPTRCGLRRDGRRFVDDSGRVDDLEACPSWDDVIDDLGVRAGDLVLTGVGVWDMFDWAPRDGPASSVADPSSAERLGRAVDDVVDAVRDVGATLVILEPLAPPPRHERVGGVWREPVWSPARVAAWRRALSAAVERHGPSLRVVAAPDDDLASGRARRPDGFHLVGDVSAATRARVRNAIR